MRWYSGVGWTETNGRIECQEARILLGSVASVSRGSPCACLPVGPLYSKGSVAPLLPHSMCSLMRACWFGRVEKSHMDNWWSAVRSPSRAGSASDGGAWCDENNCQHFDGVLARRPGTANDETSVVLSNSDSSANDQASGIQDSHTSSEGSLTKSDGAKCICCCLWFVGLRVVCLSH